MGVKMDIPTTHIFWQILLKLPLAITSQRWARYGLDEFLKQEGWARGNPLARIFPGKDRLYLMGKYLVRSGDLDGKNGSGWTWERICFSLQPEKGKIKRTNEKMSGPDKGRLPPPWSGSSSHARLPRPSAGLHMSLYCPPVCEGILGGLSKGSRTLHWCWYKSESTWAQEWSGREKHRK